MTDHDALTAALADAFGLINGYPAAANDNAARNLIAALTPEARDKMLLGFSPAWASRGVGFSRVARRWSVTVYDGEDGPNAYYDDATGEGPTPIAAVRAALKEATDG